MRIIQAKGEIENMNNRRVGLVASVLTQSELSLFCFVNTISDEKFNNFQDAYKNRQYKWLNIAGRDFANASNTPDIPADDDVDKNNGKSGDDEKE